MSFASEADDADAARRPAGRVIAAVVLGIIGILLIIAAIIYFAEPAKSLPSFMGAIKFNGHNAARADTKRSLRGVGTLVVGVVCLVAAWFAYAWKRRERY